MGEFRYICSECQGEECGHGGQQDYQPADVIVEVPLSDGKTIHLKAHYEGCGYVAIKLNKETTYEFYLEQFRQYFKDWLIDSNEEYRSECYLCTKIYTVSEKQEATNINQNARPGQTISIDYHCADDIKTVKLTKDILSKCIRADAGMNLPNYLDYLVERVETHKAELLKLNPKLEQLKQSLSNITETSEYKEELETSKKYIEKTLSQFKDYLEGYCGYDTKKKFDKYKWWTNSEKQEIEKLKDILKKEDYEDEFNKQFEIFRQQVLSKDLDQDDKKECEECAIKKIEREIHEQEYQINWRTYSIESNERDIIKEKERLSKLSRPIKRKLRL
jgi:hypothetical protein